MVARSVAGGMRAARILRGIFLSSLGTLLGVQVSMADVVTSVWQGNTGLWSDPTAWSPPLVPKNTAVTQFNVEFDGGELFSDIVTHVDHLNLMSGDLFLESQLTVESMTMYGGRIKGAGNIRIVGDLELRGGLVNQASRDSTGFDVGGTVFKRGFGTARLAHHARGGDYPIVVEQGKLGVLFGGFASTTAGVTISGREFARIDANSYVEDDLFLNNARGFAGTGALVNNTSDRGTIAGDIYLGDEGSVIGFQDRGDRLAILGNIHGGDLRVVGRNGRLTLSSGDHTYTGKTIIGIHFHGTQVVLEGEARLINTSAIELGPTAFLTLDNEDVALADRIGDDIPVRLHGGVLEMTAGAADPTLTETVGPVTFVEGNSFFYLHDRFPRLTVARLDRQDHATAEFVGIQHARLTNSARLFVDDAVLLDNHIIGGWASVNTDFATYDPAFGISSLNDDVPRPTEIELAGATDHVRIRNDIVPLTGDRTIATLAEQRTGGGLGSDLGGHKVTLAQGGLILGRGLHNGAITAGTDAAPTDLYVHSFDNVEVAANIVDNAMGGSVSLVKAGLEELHLSGVNTYSGDTFINQGAVFIESLTALPSGGNLTINKGGLIYLEQPTQSQRFGTVRISHGGGISALLTDLEIDAAEYLVESGGIDAALAGSGTLRKTTEGFFSLQRDSLNYNGDIIIEEGILIAGAPRSRARAPQALGTGVTTVLPGGTLVHLASPIIPFSYMELNATLELAGGDVGIGRTNAESRWDFLGSWHVSEDSRLLLFDPTGEDDLGYVEVNVNAPVTLDDGRELVVLGDGHVRFGGGLNLPVNATIRSDDADVTFTTFSADMVGAELTLAGSGDYFLPAVPGASEGESIDFFVSAGATFRVDGTTTGTTSIEGGTLTGSGEMYRVRNVDGALEPDSLYVEMYIQEADGLALFELLTGFDNTDDSRLFADVAELSGIFEINFPFGANPQRGEFFDLVIARDIQASDLTLVSPMVMGELELFELMSGDHDGMQALRFTVVPEPVAAVILVTGLLFAPGRIGRQRSLPFKPTVKLIV